jgi:hypothetical protein
MAAMQLVVDSPLVVFTGAALAQCLAAFAGEMARRRKISEAEWEDFNVVRTTALTLLALIIGFSFSMAVSRYDLRKTYEEAEANAIGTQFLRAQLVPAAEAAQMRTMLRAYVDERLAFYVTSDSTRLAEIDRSTARLQSGLWTIAASAANANPTPATALVASGMNDVLNAQGYTQAAWWNRIPRAAWLLMALVSVACNLLLGYGEKRANRLNLVVLPIILSIAFALIADIDSPRGGFILVHPDNLTALKATLDGA